MSFVSNLVEWYEIEEHRNITKIKKFKKVNIVIFWTVRQVATARFGVYACSVNLSIRGPTKTLSRTIHSTLH